jgi:hypothetical protein
MAKKAAAKESGTKASTKAAKPKIRASHTTPPPGAGPTAPSPGVTIRMYCQGLGDCFLLTFFPDGPKARPTRVMIDCGVFLNTPGEPARMRAVADDIRAETGGEIDLLIVTHEHWDHISGFSHANDIFEQTFKFGEVWLSWAENPDDADARAVKADLGKKKDQLKAALGMARAQLGVAGGGVGRLLEDLETSVNVLNFLGPEGGAEAGLGLAATRKAGAARMDLDATMNWLRAKVRAKDFCSPGQRRAIPGIEGVYAYVLGPPKGVPQLRKMDPTGDQGYGLLADRVSLSGAVASLLSGDDATGNLPPGPFERRYRVSPDDAARDPFFRQRYGFPDDPLSDPVAGWRRIDNDWLVGGLGRLALQLDVGVNNTSLALAFELPDGRTLVFPGDAQIGNWLSWGSLTFKVKDRSGRDVEVTSKDLLNRAVFYKVGHHGSHNATMKAGGLEEMTSGDLVAMIPTDQEFASTKRPPKTGWEMPAHGVHEALLGFTNGRIIRADRASTDQLDQEIDPRARDSRSWEEFRDRVRFGGGFPADAKMAGKPLYVEYSIPL